MPIPLGWNDLILAATTAPSPDNNQPWAFAATPTGQLVLYHNLTRALPSDEDFMFSMLALGAAVENLCIAGRQCGREARVQLVPQQGGSDGRADREQIAVIELDSPAQPDGLYPFLGQRSSCRKPYARRPVPEEQLRVLAEAASSWPQTSLSWISDRSRIGTLARLVAAGDRIRFEYPAFHAELFRQLRFSPEEAERTRDGLDTRCLEIPRLGTLLLRWLGCWPRMRALNRLGLSGLLSLQSALLVWCTGTVGLLTTRDTTRTGYLQAGRAFQRIWLTATKLGLSLHPLGSLPIFLTKLARGHTTELSRHQQRLEQIAWEFFRIFPEPRGQGLAMLFRVGRSGPPSARSLRREVCDVLIGEFLKAAMQTSG